ncbi:MAG: hypothetical protein AABY07_00820 [Nanoarchaeota archaeon]
MKMANKMAAEASRGLAEHFNLTEEEELSIRGAIDSMIQNVEQRWCRNNPKKDIQLTVFSIELEENIADIIGVFKNCKDKSDAYNVIYLK